MANEIDANLNTVNAAKENGEAVLTLDTGYNGGDELQPDIMQDDFEVSICLKGDKTTKLSIEDANPLLRDIGEIANSDDLRDAQVSIYGYEKGFGSLYRTLDMILTLSIKVPDIDSAVILAAFIDLKKAVDEGKGFINIGRPKLGKIDDKWVANFKESPCPVLLAFFFPNADATLRSKYNTILTWAVEYNRHNFVTWISNTIYIDDEKAKDGKVACGKGIVAALKFIRSIKPKKDADVGSKDKPVDFAKKIGDNTKVQIPRPTWLEKDGNFLILGSVSGDTLTLFDVTDSDQRRIDATVKLRHATQYAAQYDHKAQSSEQISEIIQNIRKLIMPPEFLMWQDNYTMYLMPIYPTWIDDNGKVSHCRENHFSVVIEIGDIPESGSDFDTTFPVVYDGQNTEHDKAGFDVFSIGYSTKELDLIAKSKENLNIEWSGNSLISFKCMGARWETTSQRKWLPGKKDPKNGLMKYQSEVPSGFPYLKLAMFDGGNILSEAVDFDKARKEFKRWKDLQGRSGVISDIDIILAIEHGVIGIWFPPIKAAASLKKDDTKPEYVYSGEFMVVGKMNAGHIVGKWCVPEKKMERIWNFISNPWEIRVPNRLDEIVIGEGEQARECLSYEEAIPITTIYYPKPLPGDDRLNEYELRDKHYTRLPDLCSDQAVGKEYVLDENDRYRRTTGREVGKRMCIPLILVCGRMWVHLPSKPY